MQCTRSFIRPWMGAGIAGLCHGSSIPSTSTAMATVTAASRLMHSVAHTRSQSLAGCFHHRPQHHRHFEAITRLTPTTRPLSFSSIFSPSRARAFALESYLSANPEDVDRYAELYAVWLESADKKSAQQVVDNYHRVTGLYAATVTANQAVLLKNDKMFDCYLAATAMLGKDIQARLAEAAQRRGAVMTHAEKQGPPTPPVTLTDAQIASAVVSRNNPNANVRVLNRDASATPLVGLHIKDDAKLDTAESPAATKLTEDIRKDEGSDTNAAHPVTPSTNISTPSSSSTAAQSAQPLSGIAISSPSPSNPASASASTAQSQTFPSSSSPPPSAPSGIPLPNAGPAPSEPIRVIVEEAKGNLWMKGFLYIGRVLLTTFIILTLFSFILDQSGMARGAAAANTPKTFAAPKSGKQYTFQDVHGCEEAKSELEEVVEFLKDPKRFSKLGGKLPRGVLLTGPPGTGKTLLARAVAGEAGVNFLFASGSEFDEMYVGVGAKRMRELFTAAKKASPAIIFIDELDAVGGARNPKNLVYQQQTLNELLVQLDGFAQSEGVILIGATNFPQSLDKALVRPGRFDRHIVVPLPDVRGRVAILKHHMREVLSEATVDASLIARQTPGFSGAELANLVNLAAVKAARAGQPSVTLRDFDWARERVMIGSERKSAVITPAEKRLTAFHEAGHALVAILTKGSTPLYSVTCLPRGNTLGVTSFIPEMDVQGHTLQELEARLDVAFGGRVAEEIMFGKDQATTGASSDITNATRVADSMVRSFGYSELVGPMDASDNSTIAPSTRSLVDQEVRRLLQEAKTRATNVLTENKAKLETLANALIEYETLSKNEVMAILNGEEIVKPAL